MEAKISTFASLSGMSVSILRPFFEDPEREFGVREIAREVGINHTTVRKHLKKMASEGLLGTRKRGAFDAYVAEFSKQFANLKLYYNLEKLRKSGIVEFLEREFDYPVIVVFGSFAKASDSKGSDIDLCVISGAKKSVTKELLDDGFYTGKFGKALGRSVSIHAFTKEEFSILKEKDPAFVSGIANGVVLSGELDVT